MILIGLADRFGRLLFQFVKSFYIWANRIRPYPIAGPGEMQPVCGKMTEHFTCSRVGEHRPEIYVYSSVGQRQFLQRFV